MTTVRDRRPLPPSATEWAICACGARVAVYDGAVHPRHLRSRKHRAWAGEQAHARGEAVTMEEIMAELAGEPKL